jgi:hypothetical protein
MKRFLLFIFLSGCSSMVFPIEESGEEIDAGYDSDTNNVDGNVYSDTNSTLETSKELETSQIDSSNPNYFNCNGDPCVVGSQYCCWFEIVGWHCVSSLDGGVCKYQKTCGHADDCGSGQKCCLEIATGGQLCKPGCVVGEEKEL